MSIELNEEVIKAITSKGSIKVLATIDRYGEPHVVFKENIFIEAGKIIVLELIETSQTNSNLVNSIWFNRTVSINIKDSDNKSWQIKGKPVKTHISGNIYENYYKLISEKDPDIDLGAVWEIEPMKVINNDLKSVLKHERVKHPYLFHLDKISIEK